MNKVMLLGRLTRDPEMRYATGNSQLAVTRFGIAVQKRKTSSNDTDVDFFNCVAFGKTAENISRFFTKGRKIAISGRIQNNNWEDNNGVKHYGVDIIAEDFDFCDSKNESESSGSSAGNSYSSPARNTNDEKFYDMPDTEDDEELPF